MSFNCILCGHHDCEHVLDKLRDSATLSVVKCTSCGLEQLSDIPTVEAARQFYNNDMQVRNTMGDANNEIDYQKALKKYGITGKTQLNLVLPFLEKTSQILEIACGYGFLLKELSLLGFSAEGVEISNIRREIAHRNCGCNIHGFDLLEDVPQNLHEKYDLVLAFECLEHVNQPLKFVEHMGLLLKKSGRLIIEVPNCDDRMKTVCEEYRAWQYFSAHLTYFTPPLLTRLLQDAGFHDIKIRGVQRYSIENSVHWATQKRPVLDRLQEEPPKGLEWIDSIYRKKLEEDLVSDTLLVSAMK